MIYLFQLANHFIGASGVKAYNSAAAEPFLNGSSTAYVEEMYNAWLRDPASVHAVSSLSKMKRVRVLMKLILCEYLFSHGTLISATTPTQHLLPLLQCREIIFRLLSTWVHLFLLLVDMGPHSPEAALMIN